MNHPAPSFSLNCRGRLLRLEQPCVMGILNVTPDSFYDGGKCTEESAIRKRVAQLCAEGAAIIDVGGASSKPGSLFPSAEAETERVLPAIRLIRKEFPEVLISVDTWRSGVARESLNAGAHLINDISGGLLDPELSHVVAGARCPYVLMHMQGTPDTMQENPEYADVTTEVYAFFSHRIAELKALGIKDIILDPGFGFGKSVAHNFSLLRNLNHFRALGYPILAGLSRKSMINRTLGISPGEALNGTTALNTLALMQGAHILRVHDVKEAQECIQLRSALLHLAVD